jgi:hypothetical protein
MRTHCHCSHIMLTHCHCAHIMLTHCHCSHTMRTHCHCSHIMLTHCHCSHTTLDVSVAMPYTATAPISCLVCASPCLTLHCSHCPSPPSHDVGGLVTYLTRAEAPVHTFTFITQLELDLRAPGEGGLSSARCTPCYLVSLTPMTDYP